MEYLLSRHESVRNNNYGGQWERVCLVSIGPRHPSPFQYLQHKERSDHRITGIIWTFFTGAPSQKYIDYLCTPLGSPSSLKPRSLSISLSFLYLNHVINEMKQFWCGADAIYVEMWLGNNCIRGRVIYPIKSLSAPRGPHTSRARAHNPHILSSVWDNFADIWSH